MGINWWPPEYIFDVECHKSSKENLMTASELEELIIPKCLKQDTLLIVDSMETSHDSSRFD